MAHYLVIHTPTDAESEAVHPPTQLTELARTLGQVDSSPRWLRTWSPDLHDERIFSYWESPNADAILKAIRDFGFLDHMEAKAISVHEWGPADVLAAPDRSVADQDRSGS